MALRRALLTVALLATTLLVLLPGAAMAAQWLPGESREASDALSTPPRVAADTGGNSVAVWVGAGGELNAAFRPNGGPWGPAENLETEFPVTSGVAPRVVALPSGEFVAAWLADRGEGDDVIRTATRSTGGEWTAPDIVAPIACCPGLSALEAGGDGSVTVVGTDEGSPTSYTRPDGGDWGGGENVPTGSGSVFDAAPDGSLVAVRNGSCSETNCIEAAYRPPGGPWDPDTDTAAFTSGPVTGLAVAAGPDSSFTAVWGEGSIGDGSPVPPGRVRSTDRSPGPVGVWVEASAPIADLPGDLPGCPGGFGCLDVAAGEDGTRVAVWQQSGDGEDRISGAVRADGEDWGPVERVGAASTGAADVAAGVTSGGIPVVSWTAYTPVLRGGPLLSGFARGAHRESDETWDEQDLGAGSVGTVQLDDLAADGEGNALTAWTDSNGAFTAGFDGAGPRFTAFSLPSGPAGQALGFSAAADDNWSGVAGISWLFGDGTAADGASVSHVYGAGGGYVATARAADGVGNVTEQSGPVNVAAAPTPTPVPDPCDVGGTGDADKDGIVDGCDDNNGATLPVAFKTVNATVVSGDVFVKLPAGAASASQAAKPPKGFVRLEGAETIPVGATLDTAKGRVRLRTASDTRKHVQTAEFFRGRFVVRQVRQPRRKGKKRSTKLITDIILDGSSFRRACRTTTASISAKRRSKKRVRRLFGDGKGTFRTKGRNAAATVRGTRWGVQDRCDGTLVTVQRGRVSVRDLTKRKTVIVRTGHKYLAKRR